MAVATLQHLDILAEDAISLQSLLTIVLTDDQTITELNRSFRGLDSATDVLSFPNQALSPYDQPDSSLSPPLTSTSTSGEPKSSDATLILPEEFLDDDAAYFGDIIIAVPYTQAQAERHNRTLLAELDLLVVHGVLHLVGYDHDTEEKEADMWAIQDEILSSEGINAE